MENELNAQGYQIVGIQYLDKVTVTVGEEEGLEEPLKQLMTNLTSGQAEWTGGDLVYIEREQETGIDEDE